MWLCTYIQENEMRDPETVSLPRNVAQVSTDICTMKILATSAAQVFRLIGNSQVVKTVNYFSKSKSNKSPLVYAKTYAMRSKNVKYVYTIFNTGPQNGEGIS